MTIQRLAVLDQSPIPEGSTPEQALASTVELARVTESLGYHRYWVAEHHGSQSFAGSAPEILIGQIAASTRRIRVGSAGVMLMHYSPLKVAEWFKVLSAFHPGRIDLGIGRAPGSDGITAAALAYGSPLSVEYFPTKMSDLKAWLADAVAQKQASTGSSSRKRARSTPTSAPRRSASSRSWRWACRTSPRPSSLTAPST